MKHHNCLNCDTQLQGKFCSNCGQKADTHRITFKHFIMHDVLHGVWHFEKGMLFTAKEALLRPGKAALDYIAGKRIRYYNVFYFILLLIGLNIFVNHYYQSLSDLNLETKLHQTNKNDIEQFISSNAKSIIFAFVPFFALNSFILFRKKKLNLSEHFILAGITFLGVLIITLLSTLTGFLEHIKYLKFISVLDGFLTPFLLFGYLIFSYYTAFGNDYTKFRFSLRMMLFFGLLLFEFILLFLIIFGYVSDWKFGNFSYHA